MVLEEKTTDDETIYRTGTIKKWASEVTLKFEQSKKEVKNKSIKPYWNKEKEQISNKLWLPKKMNIFPSKKGWFSIDKHQTEHQRKFNLNKFSLPESLEDTPSKPTIKTLKIRLFPDEEQKILLQTQLDQYKWYYNHALNVLKAHYGSSLIEEKKITNITLRKIVKQYTHIEKKDGDKILKSVKHIEGQNKMFKPEWWSKVPERLPRGAIYKLVGNVNSALSNYHAGNISKFDLKHRSKNNPTAYLLYEDKGFPADIRQIKSNYWFRTEKYGRKNVSFQEIFNSTQKRGCEIIYEKHTDRYFLHYPVDYDWYHSDDRRTDNSQAGSKGRVIALDPGIRKFLVGYDPRGKITYVGQDAKYRLIKLLLEIDQCKDKKKRFILWKRVKNLITDLHWKTVKYLTVHYDTVLLPEFRVSEMVVKKNLSKMTKRLMNMFSFYSFKQKLKQRFSAYDNKEVIIVDESYTSCTCGRCGQYNNVKGQETYSCSKCNLVIDRDISGARNILIKNLTLR